MRVRIGGIVSAAALALMLLGAGEMRADTIFSNFGANQTYSGVSWWNVGNSTNPAGTQVVAFSFVPTATGTVTGADLALALVPPPGSVQTVTPLTVYIESNAGGAPGSILATLTQTGSYTYYPTTSVVSFACTTGCSTLDAGSTYWIVGQQTDPANTTGWLWSPTDTGTWYYNELDSATGPWTVANPSGVSNPNATSAFDITGTLGTSAVPEPGSLALLGTGMLGGLAAMRRKVWRG